MNPNMKFKKSFVTIFWTILLTFTAFSQPDWHVQTSPVVEDLISVSFADTVNGWAVSDSGTVICTIDGGITWKIQRSFNRFLPQKIFFQDKQTGWLTGVDTTTNDTASILKTMDGGATWDTSYVILGSKIFDIFFINDTMGWAVGFTSDTLGLRLHTIDAGLTWNIQSGINVMSIFSSIHFRDTEEGDLCGPCPVMLHTNSGGRGTSPWALEITNLKKPMYDLVNLGELYGCMVGADGKFFFTKDQWVNFMEYDYSEKDTLLAVDAIEPFGFWAVGEDGTILSIVFSQIFGQALLEDQSQDISQDLVDLDAIDDAHVWAVGEEGTILFYGFEGSSGLYNPVTPELRIFPNPAMDQIRIENIANGTDKIELYSLEGKLLRTEPLLPGCSSTSFEVMGLETGTYILKAGEARHRIIVIPSPE
jgi:hypothetical protein